jgi:hypothetical protein
VKLDRPCTIDELPIPTDVRVTNKWTDQMREMEAHIGAFRTLQIIDALGGQQIDIPSDPANNRMASVIGDEGAAIMSRIYGGNKLWVPVGRAALNEARRGGIIAAIRARKMTIAEGAPILKTSRSYLGYLVNKTDEGEEVAPYVPKRSRHDPRQIEMFPQADAAE